MSEKVTVNANLSESRAYDIVLSFLKSQIRDGELALGDKLPSERTLTAQLNLSRNSIREALRQLENMGFIHSIHGQGNFLVNHAGKGFSSIFSMLLLLRQTEKLEFLELRQVLETASLVRAIHSPSPASIKAMEQAVSDMEQARNQNQMEQAESRFHQNLIAASQNQLYCMIMDALSDLDDIYRKETLSHMDPAVRLPLLQTHRDLVRTLKDRNEKEGCIALQRHFELIGYGFPSNPHD